MSAGGAVTRVLGTRFTVRAYPDEETVDVAVAEGRVAVRSQAAPAEAEVVLVDGEGARVDPRGRARRVESDVDALLAWTDGR